ncbi:hypothetical protein CK203_040167 [Vitis vinifera]|uniref:HAT C-terminal dimerisation domain-containing protein n=1 Tax=Vitis vinifera TaxID=29760 RepID=A0A438H2Y6_VITVI|nr:hypothetical protein CK203_040167 [Vitis vinifera]
MNMGSEYANEDLFGLENEDIGEEINSRTNVTNISSGGSNRGRSGGRTFSSKKPRQKGPMDHFFTPNAEMVVQNRRSRKMNQTTINDAYKKEARERACMLITRWMYEAAIPFNAITYLSFQPMIEAIGQYGVGNHVHAIIDASSMIKTGEKMFELLDKWVEQVGEKNVIQVITDNHSSYVMAGLLNMMRRFTGQRELLRPAKTRFATAFITLSRLHEQKNNLRKMFTSSNWSDSKWAKEQKGKTIANIVLMPSFWNTIVFCLKVSGPLVRLVDGEKKAPMGYIYEAMNRAKDTIVRSFNGNEEKYKEIFNIIDKRWEIQLHRPLHAVGYFLNPEFFYYKPEIEHDAEIMSDLYKCILRLTRDPAKQEKVVAEVSLFTNAQGLFGNELAVRTRKTRAPAEWWAAYGASAPNLQKFAMKVLDLTCSASGCKRNWSIFENIHSKRRNRLDHQHLNDLVYIKYNRALKRRYNERNTIDPISLKDIDDSNEWLIGRMEYEDSHGGAQDDFVFDDDNLTWGDVAKAAGVEEARTLPSHSLIDEDEDGGMVDSADEEDGEGYKCGDGNDDDDDFVDLKEE